MRLIDADALIEYWLSDKCKLNTARKYLSDYIESINEMPTAFELEKVLDEISETKEAAKQNIIETVLGSDSKENLENNLLVFKTIYYTLETVEEIIRTEGLKQCELN